MKKPAVGNDGRLIFLLRTLDRSCPIARGTGPWTHRRGGSAGPRARPGASRFTPTIPI